MLVTRRSFRGRAVEALERALAIDRIRPFLAKVLTRGHACDARVDGVQALRAAELVRVAVSIVLADMGGVVVLLTFQRERPYLLQPR